MKALLFSIAVVVGTVVACTNFLVTPGASEDGASMISYAADSHALYGGLYHKPAAKYPPGTEMEVYDWDSGVYLGNITQAEETYNVIGNTNEWGVAIGETTYGGLEPLQHQTAKMDYGSMIYISLQRSKTAREAIKTMTDLVATYGYYSQGESFSIADPTEVWVLEMIGKGDYETGAVWVACRVPDGHVTAHANQARITTFLDGQYECINSSDVVSFAKEHGFYPKDADEKDFSFSDVYAPLSFESVNGCEMRVWSFFRSVVSASELDKYKDYVSGKNYTNRMPWSYKPRAKVSHRMMMDLMKDHYEATDFEFASDVGAGAFHAPYRWRPMDFTVGDHTYSNPRSTSTQQTAWVFVAQLRPNMPDPFKALNWFGVDDAANTVFMPFYGAINQVPDSLVLGGKAKIMNFSEDSAFWIFNLVSQMAYDRWDQIHPEILEKATAFQEQFDDSFVKTDKSIQDLVSAGKTDEAITLATNYSVSIADDVFKEWKEFWLMLVARHIDGLTKYPVPGEQNPNITWPGYGQAWYDRIVKETGDKYLMYFSAPPKVACKRPLHKIW